MTLIKSWVKWLCLYGVLFDNAKNYLLSAFSRHGFSEAEIEGMLRNNYNYNRGEFGGKKMEIYDKKKEGIAYRGKYLEVKFEDSCNIKQETDEMVSCFIFCPSQLLCLS